MFAGWALRQRRGSIGSFVSRRPLCRSTAIIPRVVVPCQWKGSLWSLHVPRFASPWPRPFRCDGHHITASVPAEPGLSGSGGGQVRFIEPGRIPRLPPQRRQPESTLEARPGHEGPWKSSCKDRERRGVGRKNLIPLRGSPPLTATTPQTQQTTPDRHPPACNAWFEKAPAILKRVSAIPRACSLRAPPSAGPCPPSPTHSFVPTTNRERQHPGCPHLLCCRSGSPGLPSRDLVGFAKFGRSFDGLTPQSSGHVLNGYLSR
jgi:hypothetical protein